MLLFFFELFLVEGVPDEVGDALALAASEAVALGEALAVGDAFRFAGSGAFDCK